MKLLPQRHAHYMALNYSAHRGPIVKPLSGNLTTMKMRIVATPNVALARHTILTGEWSVRGSSCNVWHVFGLRNRSLTIRMNLVNLDRAEIPLFPNHPWFLRPFLVSQIGVPLIRGMNSAGKAFGRHTNDSCNRFGRSGDLLCHKLKGWYI